MMALDPAFQQRTERTGAVCCALCPEREHSDKLAKRMLALLCPERFTDRPLRTTVLGVYRGRTLSGSTSCEGASCTGDGGGLRGVRRAREKRACREERAARGLTMERGCSARSCVKMSVRRRRRRRKSTGASAMRGPRFAAEVTDEGSYIGAL
jgi:hypothetical protein